MQRSPLGVVGRVFAGMDDKSAAVDSATVAVGSKDSSWRVYFAQCAFLKISRKWVNGQGARNWTEKCVAINREWFLYKVSYL